MSGHRWDAPALDALTARLVRRFGPAVTGWAAGVPRLIDALAARWDLAVGAPFPSGASSVAVRATRATGAAAVLKLSPDLPFLAEQVAVLRLYAPSGRVPAVLAADEARGAVLLARVRPGTPLADLPTPPGPAAYAALLTALHGVAPPAPGLLPRDVRQWTDEFLHRAIDQLAEPAVGAVLRRADLDRALGLRDELLADPDPEPVLLHGDLHLGNVLDGGPEAGLVAIDPKSCVGDRCFDAADYVLGGAGRDPGDRIDDRLPALAEAAGLDRDRLLAWCRVIAPGNAVPLLRRGGAEREVADLLALASSAKNRGAHSGAQAAPRGVVVVAGTTEVPAPPPPCDAST